MLWQDLRCAIPGGALGTLGWCPEKRVPPCISATMGSVDGFNAPIFQLAMSAPLFNALVV